MFAHVDIKGCHVGLYSYTCVSGRCQLVSMSNYIEREVVRRAFVVERWNFREKEKMEHEAEAKKRAGVSSVCMQLRPSTAPVRHTRCQLLLVFFGSRNCNCC